MDAVYMKNFCHLLFSAWCKSENVCEKNEQFDGVG